MAGLIPPELQDLSSWPTVDPSAVTGQRRADLLSRMEAIRLYIDHVPLQTIESATGVQRSVLYRLLRRCIQSHPDGRLRGFRALVPYSRAKGYERTKPVAPTTRKRTAGSAGAMTTLLQRHESLTLFLRRCLSERAVYIGEAGQMCGLHDAHRGFLDACRELGLKAADYPLNQERRGIRSLSKALRQLAAQSFTSAARAAGAERDARQRVVGHRHRQPGRLAQHVGEFVEQGAAAGQDDALVDDDGLAERVEAMRAELAAAPVEVVVANHCYGLFELAAVYLSEQPPLVDQARLAIDALGCLVDGLDGRLGEGEGPLKEGLTNLRLAYVQIDGAQRAGADVAGVVGVATDPVAGDSGPGDDDG